MNLKTATGIVCRMCGACCIAPSISTVIPGTGKCKPAGVRCVHLSADHKCLIYSKRPDVCREFSATADLCGSCFEEALANLTALEEETHPGSLLK